MDDNVTEISKFDVFLKYVNLFILEESKTKELHINKCIVVEVQLTLSYVLLFLNIKIGINYSRKVVIILSSMDYNIMVII